MLSVSVVVATYNRGEQLLDTLEDLAANTYGNFHIIVVDQTESYSTGMRARLHRLVGEAGVEYVRLPVANLPLARNVGARRRDADVILFVDDDIACRTNFVESHVACYSREPKPGAVAGRITRPDESAEDLQVSSIENVGRILEDGSTIRNFNFTAPGIVEWGMGCNMSFSREALHKAGYFDERYTRTAFYEEVDVFVRLGAIGYVVTFEPTAHVVHLKMDEGGVRSDAVIARRASIVRNRTLFLLNAARHRPIHHKYRTILRTVTDGSEKLARGVRNPLVSFGRKWGALSVFAASAARGWVAHALQRPNRLSARLES